MSNENHEINILLVEDDDGDALAVKRALKKARIANTVTRAYDGVEALEYLRGENGRSKLPRPCLLLVDLNMPRMGGLELVEEIRKDEALKRMVVFVLTTSKRDEDKCDAYNLQVAGYIVKERAGEDFLNMTDLVESYWRIVEFPS